MLSFLQPWCDIIDSTNMIGRITFFLDEPCQRRLCRHGTKNNRSLRRRRKPSIRCLSFLLSVSFLRLSHTLSLTFFSLSFFFPVFLFVGTLQRERPPQQKQPKQHHITKASTVSGRQRQRQQQQRTSESTRTRSLPNRRNDPYTTKQQPR